MEKSKEPKKRPFFKESPKELSKLLNSVSDKIFEAHPFSFLTSKENREYAEALIKECGVTENDINDILCRSFESDSFVLEVCGDDPDLYGPGEAIYKGYTKAIEALERAAGQRAITEDKTYKGSRYGRDNISLKEAIQDDIEAMKKKRAGWMQLFTMHPELKAEPIPRTVRRMFENQAFCLFSYIKKKANGKTGDVDIYALLSELFIVIYDHPAFNAAEKFTPEKIKEYCDNGQRDRRMKKSPIRKYIESL